MARNNYLSAEHLPDSQSIQADRDRASRVFDENTERKIPLSHYDNRVDMFGQSDIDLFASRLKCTVCCSWYPDHNALFIDAFSRRWNCITFPYVSPFQLNYEEFTKDMSG